MASEDVFEDPSPDATFREEEVEEVEEAVVAPAPTTMEAASRQEAPSRAHAELSTLERDVASKTRAGGRASAPGAIASSQADRIDNRIAAKKGQTSQLNNLEQDVLAKSRGRGSTARGAVAGVGAGAAANKVAANASSSSTASDALSKSRAANPNPASSPGAQASGLDSRIRSKQSLEEDVDEPVPVSVTRNVVVTSSAMSSSKTTDMPVEREEEPVVEGKDMSVGGAIVGGLATSGHDATHKYDNEVDEKAEGYPEDKNGPSDPSGSGHAGLGLGSFVDDPEGVLGEKLAIAVAVQPEDEDDMFIPSAIEYDPDSKPPLYKNRRFRLYGIGMMVLVIVLIVIVSVVVTSSSSSANARPVPTQAPTDARQTMNFMERFAQIVGNDVLEDVKSPQRRAADWLILDDGLKVTPSDSNLIQRFVLASFYFSTTVNNPWRSCNPPQGDEGPSCLYSLKTTDGKFVNVTSKAWLSHLHECEWAGIICDDKGVVQAIDAYGNQLEGTIPAELSALTYLQSLGVFNNFLYGTLPEELSELENLINLEVHVNYLTGEIPLAYWDNAEILRMNFGRNTLTGTIPEEFAQVGKIKGFFLYETLLWGSIPSSIGNLQYMSFMRLQGNGFTGSIPTEIAYMDKLHELFLYQNDLIGGIPSELGRLVDCEDLRMQDNVRLGGKIPEEIYNLRSIERLYLDRMGLTGTISKNVSKLGDMVHFIVRKNALTGTIPTELALIPNLEFLWLHYNDLSGPVPPELCMKSPPIDDITADCRAVTVDEPKNPCECCYGCCDTTCRKAGF